MPGSPLLQAEVFSLDHYCSTTVARREGVGGEKLAPKVTCTLAVGGIKDGCEGEACPAAKSQARRRYGLDAGATRGRHSRNARMIQVRHRSHATYSRQPRQVRKEATVTGSCVCSESPVPGLFFSALSGSCPPDYQDLQLLYDSLRKKRLLGHQVEVSLGKDHLPLERRTMNRRSIAPKLAPHVTIRVSGQLFQGHLAVSGALGPVGGGVPIVAAAESLASGGVGPGGARRI